MGYPRAALGYPRRSGVATEVPRRQVIDVRDYGVKGDLSADAAPGINQAITDGALLKSAKVFVPKGDYLITAAIQNKSGVVVTSNAVNHGYIASNPAYGAATLQAGPGMTGFMVDNAAGGITGAGFVGIDVRGNGLTGGVRLRSGRWCVVSAIHADNQADEGFVAEGGTASVFEDLLTTNVLLDRTRSEISGALDLGGTDHYVSRCELSTSLADISDSDLRVAAAIVRGTNNFVMVSVGELSDLGWLVTGGSNRFVGVRADRNWGNGFIVPGGNNQFSSCTSHDNGQSAANTYDGWVISGFSNTLAACASSAAGPLLHRYAFNDQVDNADPASRTEFAACAAANWLTAPYLTQGFLGSAPIIAPAPIRPASGTAVISVANTTLVVLSAYTGATTVTGFSHGATGQTVRLLGSSFVTLANNSTIVTNTGADKTLVNERIYEFTYYNGKWYEAA